MQLLIETELSVAEIADKMGFCNSNYFNKIFKQYMGVSPLAYRKGQVPLPTPEEDTAEPELTLIPSEK